MNLALRSAISATLVAALPLSAGVAAQEVRRIEGLSFSRVVVLGDIEVEISQADVVDVQLRGDEEDLDRAPFAIKRGALVIGETNRYGKDDFEDLQVRIAMPALDSLRLQGSGDIYIQPFEVRDSSNGKPPLISIEGSGDIKLFAVQGPSLELRVKGSGTIKAVDINVEDLEGVVAGSGDLFIQTLQAKYAELVVTGSGDLTVTEGGFAQTLEVNVVGSGDARLESLSSERAEVNIVGSGSARIGEVLSQLNASVLGSGDVSYAGDPEVDSVQLGSGEVRRRD